MIGELSQEFKVPSEKERKEVQKALELNNLDDYFDEIHNALFVANSAVRHIVEYDYQKPLGDIDRAIKLSNSLYEILSNKNFQSLISSGVKVTDSTIQQAEPDQQIPDYKHDKTYLEKKAEINIYVKSLKELNMIAVRSREAVKQGRKGGRKLETKVKFEQVYVFSEYLAGYWCNELGKELDYSFDHGGFARFLYRSIKLVLKDKKEDPTHNEIKNIIQKTINNFHPTPA